jgi:NADH-quinone oxidoreductase subunit A|tara:strand:+ start:587 stop:985 length:399 start_codon:yes stop_codon:yes gene_type:complete
MDEFSYFEQYGVIAIFASLAVAIPVGMFLISWLLSLVKVRPDNPSEIKSSIYECGFETIDTRWNTFNFRYYSIALLFVIFDVEVIFLFPWAANFGYLSAEFGAYVLAEMGIFIGILLLGWFYAWKKGSLEWS